MKECPFCGSEDIFCDDRPDGKNIMVREMLCRGSIC